MQKPGYKTLGFYAMLTADLSALVLMFADVLPGKWTAGAVMISKALYLAGRWLQKASETVTVEPAAAPTALAAPAAPAVSAIPIIPPAPEEKK